VTTRLKGRNYCLKLLGQKNHNRSNKFNINAVINSLQDMVIIILKLNFSTDYAQETHISYFWDWNLKYGSLLLRWKSSC